MERYVLAAQKKEVEEAFDVGSSSEVMFKPNYNVIPGTVMPVVLMRDGERVIKSFEWGYRDAVGEEAEAEFKIEKVKESPDWDEKLKKEACIIPVSGFYKWKETVEDPLPFYLRVISDDVTGFAGVCSSFEDKNGRTINTFAILTMPANALVEPLDERMPVILKSKEYESWLDGNARSLIDKGFNADDLLPHMTVFRVPELVNDPSNNSKELIQPIPKLRNYDGSDNDD
ncbi:MAG: SOS response-associated peptidase [Gracilimonas sp.]|nr:SOS response-associated peptidase [Gracilimonas sp.]